MSADKLRLRRLGQNLRTLSSAFAEMAARQAALQQDLAILRYRATHADGHGEAALSAPAAMPERRRVALISSLSEPSAASRAVLLAKLYAPDWDVEILALTDGDWEHSGLRDSVWEAAAVRVLPIACFRAFFADATVLASCARYDLVHVLGPQLPALLLGGLLKQALTSPLLIDAARASIGSPADHPARLTSDLPTLDATAFVSPTDERAVRLSDELLAAADTITVSTTALRARHGGHLVRPVVERQTLSDLQHGDNAESKRHQVARAALGIGTSDFAVLMVADGRSSDRLLEVATALAALSDPDLQVRLVAEAEEQGLEKRLTGLPGVAVVGCQADVGIADKAILAAADVIVHLADTAAEAALDCSDRFVSSIAAGVPIVTEASPAVADLAMPGALIPVPFPDLAITVAGLKHQRDNRRAETAHVLAKSEFSLAVNRGRLMTAVDTAIETARTVRSAAVKAGGAQPDLQALIERASELYRAGDGGEVAPARSAAPQATSAAETSLDLVVLQAVTDGARARSRADRLIHVLIDGRAVNRVLDVLGPVALPDLAAPLREAGPNGTHESRQRRRMLAVEMLDRTFGLADQKRWHRRAICWGWQPGQTSAGVTVAGRHDFPALVAAAYEAWGPSPAGTMMVASPSVEGLAEVVDGVRPSALMIDLAEPPDWAGLATPDRERLEHLYRQAFVRADVVIAADRELAATFEEMAGTIRLVPDSALGEAGFGGTLFGWLKGR